MSKYSRGELRQKAQKARLARIGQPKQYAEMVLRLCVSTGLSPVEVNKRIEELAR